jgi:hypothetical protein
MNADETQGNEMAVARTTSVAHEIPARCILLEDLDPASGIPKPLPNGTDGPLGRKHSAALLVDGFGSGTAGNSQYRISA